MVIVLRTIAHLHDNRSHFPDVLAYPLGFGGILTVVNPVKHAEIGVLPRSAVDDTAVGGDTAGHTAVPHLFVTVVEFRPGEFMRHAVCPQQRLARCGVFEHFAFHGKAHPIFAVGRSSLYLRLASETCRRLRNEDIAGKVDGYLAAIRTVADEEQPLVGNGHGLMQVVHRFRVWAELMPLARLQVHNGRRV